MENNHDVFISHSSSDSNLAYSICEYLEQRNIRCWIAPRDVQGGIEYAESIILGIRQCKIMVVVFTESANSSIFVKNEVERAFNYKSTIIPLKIDQTVPSAALELFLGSVHWLDASQGKPEASFESLYQTCARTLGVKPQGKVDVQERPVSVEMEQSKDKLVSAEPETTRKPKTFNKTKWIFAAALSIIVLLGIFMNLSAPKVAKGNTPNVENVKIGNQYWTVSNLNVDTFRNGDKILEVKTDEAWVKAGRNKKPAWCYYKNNPKYGKKYGKLYNWYAVNDPRGLAPEGYHIPTDTEWTLLIRFLGGEEKAGLQMKAEKGWYLWEASDTTTSQHNEEKVTNLSGFSGLPGGIRNNNGTYNDIGRYGDWWSATEDDTDSAWDRYLDYSHDDVGRFNSAKGEGLSVRCLRD